MNSLRQLGLFLTESCNLACPYCFAANMERQAIDVGLAKRAIDLLFLPDVTAKNVGLTFWGGEPLLEFDLLKDLALYALDLGEKHSKTVRLGLPTNATLLTDAKIDFLLEHNINISLSLDGNAKAQALRQTRGGKSSFPIIEKKLALIKKRYNKRLPGVRMTVSPGTAANFYENVRFFLDQGFPNVFFAPVHEAEWTSEDLADFEREQYKLADNRASEFKAGKITAFNSWDKILAWKEMKLRGTVDASSMKISCGAGTTLLAVDIYGDIYPCHRFAFYDKSSRAQALGHVDTGLPSEESMAPYKTLDAHKVGTKEHPCADCKDLANCISVCPAVNYSLSGGDIYQIHERQCELGRLEQRAICRFEDQVRDLEIYQNYVENHLLKAYTPGGLSAEVVSFFSGLTSQEQNNAADRASEIMEQLRRQRQKHENGSQS